MPLLIIETNVEIDPTAQTDLLKQASSKLAEMLGKPERYVMISLRHNPSMLFAADDSPLAYLEMKSIGLPEERTIQLSASLCELIDKQLKIPADRIYIEFSNAQRHLWGWNSGTF